MGQKQSKTILEKSIKIPHPIKSKKPHTTHTGLEPKIEKFRTKRKFQPDRCIFSKSTKNNKITTVVVKEYTSNYLVKTNNGKVKIVKPPISIAGSFDIVYRKNDDSFYTFFRRHGFPRGYYWGILKFKIEDEKIEWKTILEFQSSSNIVGGKMGKSLRFGLIDESLLVMNCRKKLKFLRLADSSMIKKTEIFEFKSVVIDMVIIGKGRNILTVLTLESVIYFFKLNNRRVKILKRIQIIEKLKSGEKLFGVSVAVCPNNEYLAVLFKKGLLNSRLIVIYNILNGNFKKVCFLELEDDEYSLFYSFSFWKGNSGCLVLNCLENVSKPRLVVFAFSGNELKKIEYLEVLLRSCSFTFRWVWDDVKLQAIDFLGNMISVNYENNTLKIN